MGKQFTLTASDAHKLGAYRADPAGTPKGGMVVIQEIFGVNQHIRAVCDRLAGEGYVAVAPALFDRQIKDYQSGYTPEEIEKSRSFVAKPDWDAMMRDTDAAIKEIKGAGPVGIIGFCMGGTIAFLAATRLSGLSAAVAYYGGRIVAFADEGYVAVAPALFDRQIKDYQSGYTPPEIEKSRTFVAKPDWDAMMRDTDAAIKEIKGVGPVGIIGFCMGGTIAFLAATRLSGLSASVAYYGGRIVAFADEKPKCPVQMHFGEKDASIPMTDVETIKQKRPDTEIYVYNEAGHGFHCDERGSFHKPSCDLAWQRTSAFLAKHMKK